MATTYVLRTLTVLILFFGLVFGFGSERVLLTKVQVLTLYKNRMTTSRRSPPMAQLKCMGGTAGCHAFQPQTVQCLNRGSDGQDVQWECKADMDKAYKFGTVEVSCEGYDYPDDPYVLSGSCGLEYTVDYTSGHGGGWGSGGSWFGGQNYQKRSSSGFGDILMIIIIGLIIYAVYRSFRSPATHANQDYSTTNDDYPGGYPGNPGYGGQAPPPPGFRPEYMPGHGNAGGCAGNRRANDAGGGGGFWTGAAAGGLLGYLLGNNNNRGNMYNRPFAGTGGSFGSVGGGSTTGSRTASGFGGTRRR